MEPDADPRPPVRTRRGVDRRLRVDATLRPGGHEFGVALSGDFDVCHVDSLLGVVRAGLAMKAPTVVRFDGVGNFGSAGARAVTTLLDEATSAGADLRIEGVPPVVSTVFEICGIDDERIHAETGAPGPLSSAVFDSVMATGALRAREPICITNHDPADPRMVFVNEAFARLTGYSVDELLGNNPNMLQGALTDRTVINRLKTCLTTDAEFTGETVNYRADGTPFWVNWHVVTIAYGARQYYMALQRDITPLRHLARASAANGRIMRVVNDLAVPPTRTRILDALALATAILTDPADATIQTAITDQDGQVVAANMEGSFADPKLFTASVSQSYETDDTATLHLPFRLNDELTGHVRLVGLHRDWLRLIDTDLLVQLCDDCVSALQNAPD